MLRTSRLKSIKVCGISPEVISEVAIEFAKSKGSMILWGMGVSQHVHGTDNARCLIALSTITGQIGKPGTGLHPLRGQNNVQGASDAGLIPMMCRTTKRLLILINVNGLSRFGKVNYTISQDIL